MSPLFSRMTRVFFLAQKFISHLPQRIFTLTSFRLGVGAKLGQISNKLSRNWKKRPEYAMLLLNVTNILEEKGPHFSGNSEDTRLNSNNLLFFRPEVCVVVVSTESKSQNKLFKRDGHSRGFIALDEGEEKLSQSAKETNELKGRKVCPIVERNKNKAPLMSPGIRLRITQSHRGQNYFTVYVFLYKWEMVFSWAAQPMNGIKARDLKSMKR